MFVFAETKRMKMSRSHIYLLQAGYIIRAHPNTFAMSSFMFHLFLNNIREDENEKRQSDKKSLA